MSGINTSGSPSTQDYNLGRGAIYCAVLSLTTGLPDDNGYRHVGNIPEFNINITVETLEHQSSLHGLKVTDLEVIVSQKIGFTFAFDELNADNFALFFNGETATYSNATAIAGFAERELVEDVKEGRWYDIVDGSGNRVYNITAGNVTAEKQGAPDVLLVSGTDYELDTFAGRIKILEGAPNIADGDALDITLAATAAAGTVDEVRALTQTNPRMAMKFIGENPVDNDTPTEYQFHQVQLKPDGDLALIGDDFTRCSLTGTAESNEDADADSPFLTIRTLTVAS